MQFKKEGSCPSLSGNIFTSFKVQEESDIENIQFAPQKRIKSVKCSANLKYGCPYPLFSRLSRQCFTYQKAVVIRHTT